MAAMPMLRRYRGLPGDRVLVYTVATTARTGRPGWKLADAGPRGEPGYRPDLPAFGGRSTRRFTGADALLIVRLALGEAVSAEMPEWAAMDWVTEHCD